MKGLPFPAVKGAKTDSGKITRDGIGGDCTSEYLHKFQNSKTIFVS